jgi:hypothetical protein
VRLLAVRLLRQGGPLADAEAVLLVDDDQAESGEVDAGLDDGVGADQDVDLAGREGRQQDLAGRGLGAARQEGDRGSLVVRGGGRRDGAG